MSLLTRRNKKADDSKSKFISNVKLIDSDDEDELDINDFEALQLWKIPMGNRGGAVTKGTVIKALYMSNGVQAVAARALGVSRQTMVNWIKKHECIKLAYEDSRSCVADFARNKLIEAVDKGHEWAITLVLKYDSDYNDDKFKTKNNKAMILENIDKMMDDTE